MPKGRVKKTNKYYTFWGIMTIAVVIGQIYVGSGYRQMSTSIIKLIEEINVNSHTNDATTKLAELL
jgi:hypothetical protein